jgi:hypothetical protein
MRENARLTWRWFKYWRRRYVWLRLIVLVLLFAHPVYEVFDPAITRLVRIAIFGIEQAKFGPYHHRRALEFQEKKRLQQHLLVHFDRSGDGKLDRSEAERLEAATGFTAGQVTGSALNVDLDALMDANHQLGTVPDSLTANDIRRAALDAALADAARARRESKAEIDPMLEWDYPGLRDYLRWDIWKRGVRDFLSVIQEHTGLYVPGVTLLYEPEDRDFVMWVSRARRWRGSVGWLVLLGAVVISVRRYGKTEELKLRLERDPCLAAAPCPVCGEATRDYGALIHHRAARAWAAGAVVVLAALICWLLLDAPGSGHQAALRAPIWLAVTAAAGITVGLARWLLWPWEVHACRRRPSLVLLGFALGVVVVVGLLGCIGGYAMRTFEWPRQTTLMLGAPTPRELARGDRHLTHPRVIAPKAAEPPSQPAMRSARSRGALDRGRGMGERPRRGRRGPERVGARRGEMRARGTQPGR